jgi:ABC-2 type transport system permease protein
MSTFLVVLKKEFQDHIMSWRFILLMLIMVLASVYAIFVATGNIREAITQTPDFPFLALFTTSLNSGSSFIPDSLLSLIVMLIPLVGILLGMDAINSERNNGTLSRLVSQPIYRDNIINAKFAAGVTTIAVLLLTMILLVSGLGLRLIGIPPTAEEVWRILFFFVISLFYASFWLGLAMLFSTLFRQVAVSAIVSLAVWIFFLFFFPLIYEFIGGMITADTAASAESAINNLITISRLSPMQLFDESMYTLLVPGTRSTSQIIQLLITDAGQYLLPNPLSLGQSLLSVWPQIIVIILLTIICFALSYIKFMREEIRAT